MLETFERVLRQHHIVQEKDTLVLGVSGGPDSIAMADLFVRLRAKWALTLHVVHVNHMIRGEEAKADAAYVKAFCEARSIPFHVVELPIEQIAREKGWSVEEAGRKERYRVFFETADRVNARRIAVAQNKNDQAETLLMRFMRGTGVDGLAGMDYVRADGVIRPILSFSRAQIESYCKDRALEPRIDYSNQEAIYTRNRIRLELVPFIERHFNPKVTDRLFDMATLFREEAEWMEALVERWFSEHVDENDRRVQLPREEMQTMHRAQLRRIIRRFVRKDGGLTDISAEQVEGVVHLIQGWPHGALRIVGTTEFEVNYDTLLVRRGNSKGTYTAGQLDCTYIPREMWDGKRDETFAIAMDADRISGQLTVRRRQPGDRFQPFGMKGTKKLKDFFVDQKIPRDLREDIPLVCDAEGILWVVGYRKAERTRITEHTKTIAVIAWSSCSPG